MDGHRTLLLLLFSLTLAAALSPSRHLRSLLTKRGGRGGGCQVRRCVMPLVRCEHDYHNLGQAQVADEFCRDLATASSCFKTQVPLCADPGEAFVAVYSDSLERFVGYACTERGKEVMVSGANCWKNPDLERDLDRCIDFSSNDACSFMTRIRQCLRITVTTVCSAAAASFTDGAFYRIAKPVLDHYYHGDCPGFNQPQDFSEQVMDVLKRTINSLR